MKQVKKHKQLGVVFNDKMTFTDHIEEVVDKASKRLATLKRLSSKIQRKSRLDIYVSFIRPIVEFGWQLYLNSPKSSLELLDRLQRESMIYITESYKLTSTKELLTETCLQPLGTRRYQQQIKFLLKYKLNLLPEYLQRLIPNSFEDLTHINLRNKNNFIMIKTKKNYVLKSFIPASIKAWNESDNKVKVMPSVESLKMYFKAKKCYYLKFESKQRGDVFLGRIRMGLSALNAQRHSYHLIENAKCELCGHRREDPLHYFLFCPNFAAFRQHMINSLVVVLPNVFQAVLNYRDSKKSQRALLSLLVYGTQNLNDDSSIFEHVFEYIVNTERF